MLWFGLNLQHICFSCFQVLQDAQEKQQILIKQKLELENKLQNTEKDLKKVRYGEASVDIKCFKMFIICTSF